jgi:hypothetical protein
LRGKEVKIKEGVLSPLIRGARGVLQWNKMKLHSDE